MNTEKFAILICRFRCHTILVTTIVNRFDCRTIRVQFIHTHTRCTCAHVLKAFAHTVRFMKWLVHTIHSSLSLCLEFSTFLSHSIYSNLLRYFPNCSIVTELQFIHSTRTKNTVHTQPTRAHEHTALEAAWKL